MISLLEGMALQRHTAGADAGPMTVPVALAARVSTKDNQDPTLSIPRQLARCREALPSWCVIVVFFWDVESGQIDLDRRGHGNAHDGLTIPVPRDGGIADLLAEARGQDRRFVAVVCESVDRLARSTYFGTKIEHELEQCGLPLLAADEGITADALPNSGGPPARKRATPVLTRRVKQAIAEWYVLDMIERSWGGLVAHTEQGYNIGKPPYGYVASVERHPVPAKAALGNVKRRLVRDPVRGAVVTQIFAWRVVEKLTLGQIADRLNLEPDHYPPPEPIPGRGRRPVGQWTKGSVRDVLSNPKYTGHMVYNRRKIRRPSRGIPGKVNPRSEWIWSSRPTHEPLTTRAIFDAGAPLSASKQRSRPGSGLNRHPATAHTYRLRSYVICDLCGRRLYGKVRRITGGGFKYYACEKIPARHAERNWYPTHPKSLWVREDKLLTVVRSFFARRIFAADRQLFLDQPRAADPTSRHTARMQALQTRAAELQRQQANLVQELREHRSYGDQDIDRQWRNQLRDSFATVTKQIADIDAQVEALTASQAQVTDPGDPDLLNQLPVGAADLARVPEELERALFDAFQLQLRYHQPTRTLTVRVTLDAKMIKNLAEVSEAAIHRDVDNQSKTTTSATDTAKDASSLVRSAPGRIRTCAPASGGRCSIP